MEGILQRISSFSASHFRILRKEKAEEETERLKREAFLAEIKDLQTRIQALQSCYDRHLCAGAVLTGTALFLFNQKSKA